MVNLLRYRERAEYAEGAEFGADGLTGREVYQQRYLPAWMEAAEPFGTGTPLWLGQVVAGLVGPPGERWDDIAIVQYPSFAAVTGLPTSERYLREANIHRLAAIEDFRFYAATTFEL